MNFLQKIFRSRDKPQNRTPGSAWQFYMGGSTSSRSVSETNMEDTDMFPPYEIRILD